MARDSQVVANVTVLVRFWGLPGEQWTSGLCVCLCDENRTVGLVLYVTFIWLSGVIAISSHPAIISRIGLMSSQRKGIQNLALRIPPPTPHFPDFTCLILHQLRFSAQCFFQVAFTSRVCLRHYSSNQAFYGATEGVSFFLEVKKENWCPQTPTDTWLLQRAFPVFLVSIEGWCVTSFLFFSNVNGRIWRWLPCKR